MEAWTNRPDVATEILEIECGLVVTMMCEGKVTPEEGYQMFNRLFDRERLAREIKPYLDNNRRFPLESRASQLMSLRLKMAPTEPGISLETGK